MTEPSTAVTPDAVTALEATQPEVQDVNSLPEWARASLTKANQEAARYRTQVAELRPKADQFSALEEASKSETQRLSEAAESARQELEAARSEATRYKVAATFGIPADHFDLLGSGTEDEITARAEKVSALIAAQAAPQTTTTQTVTPPRRPLEQLRPGATPAVTETEDDVVMASLFGPGH